MRAMRVAAQERNSLSSTYTTNLYVNWCRREDSNLRLTAYKTVAVATEPLRQKRYRTKCFFTNLYLNLPQEG